MRFGNLILDQKEVNDLTLLLGHCVSNTNSKLLKELDIHNTSEEEPDWERVKPIIQVEDSQVIQFELHLGEEHEG